MDNELPGVTGAYSNPAHFPGRTLGLQKCLSSTQTMKSIFDGEAVEACAVSIASHHVPMANE